jgi:hypothetical protein
MLAGALIVALIRISGIVAGGLVSMIFAFLILPRSANIEACRCADLSFNGKPHSHTSVLLIPMDHTEKPSGIFIVDDNKCWMGMIILLSTKGYQKSPSVGCGSKPGGVGSHIGSSSPFVRVRAVPDRGHVSRSSSISSQPPYAHTHGLPLLNWLKADKEESDRQPPG